METKQSMDCILKDPNAKSNKPVIPRLITVNPLNIIIESKSGQIDKTLELKNIYPCRVAFRIQTNGPTRYTVCPNKGFLSIGEKSMIQITMIDGNKYQSNHQFIVQAMPAPGDFADRKLIWKQPNYLGILTNTRVKTMRPGQPLSKPRSKSPSGLTTPIDNSGMNSPAVMDSNESLVTPSAPSWTAPVSSIDHGKYADKINDLASQVKKAIAEKNTRASEMVSVVNQIKSIEVELDRQAQLVNEMSERVKKGELQYSNLVLHERTIRSDLERMKNNDMDPFGP
ncbi:hypothetical protein CRE_26516 [Caenorhabditis remanei]|uniref:Major sperm protein n=1 Tax=Caenorhabditis remanei TaxID=31234 RepID=E3LQZ7_CAERE|nr:hypothetical protein CRE_26516 [Caenorhabditis remanei]